MLNNTKVSIILVTYNSSSTIIDALESIYRQTFSNLELIVADDHSTDNSVDIINNWLSEKGERFTDYYVLESKQNLGTCANTNRAIKKSTGIWIKLIAGDDALLPDCIEKNIKFIETHSKSKWISSKSLDYLDYFSDRTKVNNSSFYEEVKPLFELDVNGQLQHMVRSIFISAPTQFFERGLLETVGGFDEKYNILDDAPMHIKLLEGGVKCYFLDTYTVQYRKRGNSKYLFSEELLKYKKIYTQDMRLKYFSNYERYSFWLKYFIDKSFCLLGLNRNNIFCRCMYKIINIFIFPICSKDVSV